MVKEEVSQQLKGYFKKFILYPLLIIVSIIILIFIAVPAKSIFSKVLEFFYPPSEIYKDIKDTIREDILKKEFTPTKDPQLKKEIQELVWSSLASGDSFDFDKILTSAKFADAMRSTLNNEMLNAFEVPGSAINSVWNDNSILIDKIKETTSNPISVKILVLNKSLDSETTNCGRKFDHKKKQAILRIPINRKEFDWFRCGGTVAPNYFISIKTLDDDARPVEEVNILSIEHQGDSNELQLKVSQKVASELFPGEKNYKSNTSGTFQITGVKWQ